MPQLQFQGIGQPLSADGFAAVSRKLGVHAPEIWTVLAVETSGCGYLPDQRPKMLYERHIFHRLTHGKHDDGDISDATPGGYGRPGAHQYDRLAQAISKNRAAALQSCSWGIGQIMGENYALAGLADVESMVAAMAESEDQQLAAMANFLIASRLDIPLQTHDWASFARGYNGPNYALNRYDIRLNSEFQKCSAGGLPDLNVRAAQLYLTYLHFCPGAVDGIAGSRTLSALADFQTQINLPKRSPINAETVAQLSTAFSGPASAEKQRQLQA
jgi:hypothetical protein